MACVAEWRRSLPARIAVARTHTQTDPHSPPTRSRYSHTERGRGSHRVHTLATMRTHRSWIDCARPERQPHTTPPAAPETHAHPLFLTLAARTRCWCRCACRLSGHAAGGVQRLRSHTLHTRRRLCDACAWWLVHSSCSTRGRRQVCEPCTAHQLHHSFTAARPIFAPSLHKSRLRWRRRHQGAMRSARRPAAAAVAVAAPPATRPLAAATLARAAAAPPARRAMSAWHAPRAPMASRRRRGPRPRGATAATGRTCAAQHMRMQSLRGRSRAAAVCGRSASGRLAQAVLDGTMVAGWSARQQRSGVCGVWGAATLAAPLCVHMGTCATRGWRGHTHAEPVRATQSLCVCQGRAEGVLRACSGRAEGVLRACSGRAQGVLRACSGRARAAARARAARRLTSARGSPASEASAGSVSYTHLRAHETLMNL
eukprot:2742362-Prymnesium_polylepis.1